MTDRDAAKRPAEPPRWMRNPTTRLQLSAGFHAICTPLLRDLGFRNPAKGDRQKWEATRKMVFARWRGPHYEQVEIVWRTLDRPRFFIRFKARHLEEPMGEAGAEPTYRLVAGDAAPWRFRLLGYETFGYQYGFFMSPKATLELAKRRLAELNDYFLSGVVTQHILLGHNYSGQAFRRGDRRALDIIYWDEIAQPHELEPPRKTRKRA